MSPEFEALNKYVRTIGPGDLVIMFSNIDATVIAKTRRRWGTQECSLCSGRFERFDQVYIPARDLLRQLLQPALETAEVKYGPHLPSELGRRHIFVSKRNVIKFPRDIRGMIDNFSEAYLYSLKTDPNLARCRIGHINRLPVLVMEKINIDPTHPDIPKWADNTDRRQVGLNRKGQWKAYDYGIV